MKKRRERKNGRADRGGHLQDLSVDVEGVDGDLHVAGHTLATLLKLAPLQGNVKVVPHLTFMAEKHFVTLSLLNGYCLDPCIQLLLQRFF